MTAYYHWWYATINHRRYPTTTGIDITTLDWIILTGYIVAVTIIGFLAGRRVKSTDHYFLGNRDFGKWLMIGQSFSVGTHAEMPVSLAGAVQGIGVSAIWYQWKNLFATPFYWLIAPLFRRIRRTTTAEMVEDRYGPWMGAIYTVFALCFFTVNGASMLKGAGKVIGQVTGGGLTANQVVVALTVVFVVYSLVGGLVATAWTDILQGFLIIVLSFMLIPLGWGLVGGMAGMRATLEPFRFSLSTPQGIGPWFILMLTVNGLIGITAQPQLMSSVGTGKDELDCRSGFMYGNFTKRFCTIGWAMVGMMVTALLAKNVFGINALADPEDAFGFACRHLLFPGGVGLLIACFLAANMAACSAGMVNSGALFTRNFYEKYLVHGRIDSHYLLVGRISGLVFVLVGVVYAIFFIKRVLYSFLLTETSATFVGISVLGGILWRRANRWGALASIVTAFATNFAMYYWRNQRLDHWDPDVFLAALLAGVVALVAVSLITPPEPTGQMEDFYQRLATPALSDPKATGHQLILPNLLQLKKGAAGQNLLSAYREDLKGFAIGVLITIGIVTLAWTIMR
jgi:Na+/proline symporter